MTNDLPAILREICNGLPDHEPWLSVGLAADEIDALRFRLEKAEKIFRKLDAEGGHGIENHYLIMEWRSARDAKPKEGG